MNRKTLKQAVFCKTESLNYLLVLYPKKLGTTMTFDKPHPFSLPVKSVTLGFGVLGNLENGLNLRL